MTFSRIHKGDECAEEKHRLEMVVVKIQGYLRKDKKKNPDQCMTIDVTFIFLKTAVIRESSKRWQIPCWEVREKKLFQQKRRFYLTFTTAEGCPRVCQSGNKFKFILSGHQEKQLLRSVAIKILVQKTEGRHITSVTELEIPYYCHHLCYYYHNNCVLWPSSGACLSR